MAATLADLIAKRAATLSEFAAAIDEASKRIDAARVELECAESAFARACARRDAALAGVLLGVGEGDGGEA